MKFHTKFRPGDLVRDKKTGDEGIITNAEAAWSDKNNLTGYFSCIEKKPRGAVYQGGHYGIFPKTCDSSLNGSWYEDDQIELVKKGFLH